MEKKQTAVQWLIENAKGFHNAESSKAMQEQALRMEREQHKETWFDSTSQFANDARMDNKIDFETYYTETFKP